MTKKNFDKEVKSWDHLLLLGLVFDESLRNEWFKREYGVNWVDAGKSDEELIAMGYKEKEIK